MRHSNMQKGFSLVELSAVLLILGVVFVGATMSLSSFKHSSYSKESKANQANIKEALMNFAVINKYLPCPDTDGDGLEDRVSAGVFQACDNAVGTLPYLDIGLKREDVNDGWNNAIRYAVNTEAETANVCDKTSAGSYFCNQAANNVAWFTYADTPPLQGNLGSGNYTVCNEEATVCNGSTTSLITDSAVAVLVSYNEDGGATLANCSAASGATAENCDTTNEFYHQAAMSTAEGAFFDDIITALSGYEIKAKVLSNTTSWNSFSSTGGSSNPNATYEGYDFSTQDKDQYLQDNDINDEDAIYVNRNISTALDLGDGDDYVMIGNDLQSETIWDGRLVDGRTEGQYYNDGTTTYDGSQATLTAGDGNDTIYIANDAYSLVDLGEGDDKFVIGGDLKEGLLAGDGNDEAWIQDSYAGGQNSSTTDIDVNDYNDVRNPPPEGTTVSVTETVSGNQTTITSITTVIEHTLTKKNGKTNYTETVTTEVTVSEPASVDLGSGDDVLWLGNTEDPSSGALIGEINGGDGNDILVLENVNQWSDLTIQQQSYITGFELVVFADDGSGNRNYYEP